MPLSNNKFIIPFTVVDSVLLKDSMIFITWSMLFFFLLYVKLWCASPSHINCRKRKEKELGLEKLKETKLRQVKEQYGLNYHQRGKCIVCTRKSSLKGTVLM